jgi:WD40 repeat protein
MNESKAPRVFLSYGRLDATALAGRLATELTTNDFDVWQDTAKLIAGGDWQQKIAEAIRGSDVVLALLSPHSVRVGSYGEASGKIDSVCLDELAYARFGMTPRPIVPVMAKKCEPPFSIFHLDYIDMSGWEDAEDRYRTGWDRLLPALGDALRGEVHYRDWVTDLRPWDFSAFLYEKQRDFVGRSWVIEQTEAWIRDANAPKLMLITGDPGTGKSAIAAHMVHRNPGGLVAAYHCCQADTPATLDPARCVRSLAAMFASRFPRYSELLRDMEISRLLSDEHASRDPASAFERAVLNPIHELSQTNSERRFVLVDALDESLLHAGVPTILNILANRADRFPPWLRIVVTTRRDPEVLASLPSYCELQIDTSSRNRDDIVDYVVERTSAPAWQDRLQKSQRDQTWVAQQLLEKSEGNFLYVQKTLDAVEQSVATLDEIPGLPPGLHGVYRSFFARSFPPATLGAPIRAILEVLVASRQPVSETVIATATGLDLEYELSPLIRALAVYLRRSRGADSVPCYSIFHSSLAEWLTSSTTQGSIYFVSRRKGHERLADACWRHYREGVNGMEEYALLHLPVHLHAAKHWEKLHELLTDFVYLERRCVFEGVFALIADGRRVLEDPNVPSEWRGHLEPVVRFLDRHSHILTRAPAQIIPLALHALTQQDEADAALAVRVRAAARMIPHSWWRWSKPPSGARANVPLRILVGHDEQLQAIAFSPEGSAIVSAGFDNTVRLWSTATGEPRWTARGTTERTITGFGLRESPQGVAYSPTGTVIASGAQFSEFLPGGLRPVLEIRLWDAESGRSLSRLRPAVHRGPGGLDALAFSPNGRWIAAGVSDHPEYRIEIWDLETRSAVRVLTGHEHSIEALAFSIDGLLASASYDKSVRLWNREAGDALRILGHHGDRVVSVCFSADGSLVASASPDSQVEHWEVKIWDTHSGHCLQSFTGGGPVHFYGDGESIVSGCGVWSVKSGALRGVLHISDEHASELVYSRDGKQAATAGSDKTIKIWDMQLHTVRPGEATAYRKSRANQLESAALSTDGSMVAAPVDGGISVWSTLDGQPLHLFSTPEARVRAVAFASDGGRIAGVGSSGESAMLVIWDLANERLIRAVRLRHDTVWNLAFANIRNVIATCGQGFSRESNSLWGTVELTDAASGRLLGELSYPGWHEEAAIRAVVFSADDRAIFTGSECMGRGCAKYVGRWLPDTNQFDVAIANSDRARALIVSAQGHLAVGNDAGLLLSRAERDVVFLSAPDAETRALAFSPEARMLGSGWSDGSVRIWDIETLQLMSWAQTPEPVNALCFLSEDKVVVASAGSKESGPLISILERVLPQSNQHQV